MLREQEIDKTFLKLLTFLTLIYSSVSWCGAVEVLVDEGEEKAMPSAAVATNHFEHKTASYYNDNTCLIKFNIPQGRIYKVVGPVMRLQIPSPLSSQLRLI